MHVWHTQSFGFAFDHALVVDVWLRQLVFEKSLVVVPWRGSWTTRQPGYVFFVFDGLGVLAAALRRFGGEREIESLNGLAALVCEFCADAAFVFEARNLMASGTTVVPHPLLAFLSKPRVVHECRVRIRGRILFLLVHQIRRDVLVVFRSQAQAWHHRHVLHLQFVAIIRALAVLEIELIGKTLLRVILRPNIFLLIWTIRTSSLPCVVDPADEVVVVRLLAYAREIRSECSALHLLAFANG